MRLSERRLTAHRRNTGMLMKTIIVAGMNKAVHRAVFQLCERLFAYRWDIMTLIGVILFNQSVFASADIPEAVR